MLIQLEQLKLIKGLKRGLVKGKDAPEKYFDINTGNEISLEYLKEEYGKDIKYF